LLRLSVNHEPPARITPDVKGLTRVVLAMAALALPASLVHASGSAEAAAPTCQGHRATIVGDPEHRFSAEGTPGRDVIVTNGAPQATGGGGDDRICVTRSSASVSAGTGDDTVVVLVQARTSATLGPGDDTYLGTDAPDSVDPQGGRDVVRTFGGVDWVRLTSDRPRAVVDLGRGDDRVVVDMRSGGSRVDGGPGADVLEVAPIGRRSTTWRFDAGLGRVVVDGRVVARWSDIGIYELAGLSGKAEQLRFLGTAADEHVDLSGYAAPRRVRLELGGGDDTATVTGSDRGRVLLGTGHDGLAITRGASAQIDLVQQVAHVVAADSTTSKLALGGVDDVTTLGIADVTIGGDSDDNILRAEEICTARLHGSGGDDRLDADAIVCAGTTQKVVLEGGRGDDVLRGSFLDDLLAGGPGQDLANGEDGVDTCYAEVRLDCELP
jgi:hypothetical protein